MKTTNGIIKHCFLIFAFLTLTFCGNNGGRIYREANGGTLSEPLKHNVKIIKVMEKNITPHIKSFGSIAFQKKIDISSAVNGIINKLVAEEGDSVEKGESLAVIENIQLDIRRRQVESAVAAARSASLLAEARLHEGKLQVEARLISIAKSEIELEQKKIELEYVEKTLKNKEKVFNVGGISEEAMDALKMSYHAARTAYLSLAKDLEIKKVGLRDEDIISAGLTPPRTEIERIKKLVQLNTRTLSAEVSVAESQLDTAISELESVNQLLNEMEVISPEKGIVGARYFSEGERITEGAKIFTLFDTSSVYAVFPVQENEALLISEGMPVLMTVDALDGAEYKGRIHLISPMIDPQSGSLIVKALFENRDGLFKPGMFVRIKVIYGTERKAFFIPVTAVVQKTGNKGKLFMVVNGRAFQKNVLLGIENEGEVEVIEGLSRGEILIDSPSPVLKEGDEVERES